VNENAGTRNLLRSLFKRTGQITAKAIKEKEEDFQMMAAKKEQSWAQEFQQVVSDWAREQEFEKVWDEVSGKPLYVDNKLKHTDEIIACMNKRSSDKKLASVSTEKSKDSLTETVFKQWKISRPT
jgi:Skp family chaperone for outer membrane proteins